MKKTIGITLWFASPLVALAQSQISLKIPYVDNPSSPAGFVNGIYQFALLASGILAFGAIVYGGIRYLTAGGNPSGQTEGREWIKGAVYGLILIFGAYAILNFINPDITSLSLPKLQPLPTPAPTQPSTGGVAWSGLSDVIARSELQSVGISASADLSGVQQTTVDELMSFEKDCPSCTIIVTSATGGKHATGSACTHETGYKVDLRPNSSVDNFITTQMTQGAVRSDGAQLYTHDGAVYADERVRPSNCGAMCNWTGPHWDVAVCQ